MIHQDQDHYHYHWLFILFICYPFDFLRFQVYQNTALFSSFCLLSVRFPSQGLHPTFSLVYDDFDQTNHTFSESLSLWLSSTAQYSRVLPNTVQYSPLQSSVVQHSLIEYSRVQPSRAQYSPVLPSTTQYSILQPRRVHYNPVAAQYCTVQPLQYNQWRTHCARNFPMVQSSIVYWISQNLIICWETYEEASL